MEFERDPRKAAENVSKHGVSFHEAATVFGDPLAATFPEPDHSVGEERYVIIGLSRAGRVLVIAHTERYDRLRVISARVATPSEERFHEQGSGPGAR